MGAFFVGTFFESGFFGGAFGLILIDAVLATSDRSLSGDFAEATVAEVSRSS